MDSAQKRFILSAKEDGIEYRGDRFDDFTRICAEYEKMRAVGVEAYSRPWLKYHAELAEKLREKERGRRR